MYTSIHYLSRDLKSITRSSINVIDIVVAEYEDLFRTSNNCKDSKLYNNYYYYNTITSITIITLITTTIIITAINPSCRLQLPAFSAMQWVVHFSCARGRRAATDSAWVMASTRYVFPRSTRAWVRRPQWSLRCGKKFRQDTRFRVMEPHRCWCTGQL